MILSNTPFKRCNWINSGNINYSHANNQLDPEKEKLVAVNVAGGICWWRVPTGDAWDPSVLRWVHRHISISRPAVGFSQNPWVSQTRLFLWPVTCGWSLGSRGPAESQPLRPPRARSSEVRMCVPLSCFSTEVKSIRSGLIDYTTCIWRENGLQNCILEDTPIFKFSFR